MHANDKAIMIQKMLIPLIPEVVSGGGSGRSVGVGALRVVLVVVRGRPSVVELGLTGLENTGHGKSITHKSKLVVSKTLV